MKALSMQVVLSVALVLLWTGSAAAHCEIPCGIYDDEMRIQMMLEHAGTIEKSMNQIMALEKEKDHPANQLTRWVMNKETHANELQHIVTQYFMTQRIKPDAKEYGRQLALLHEMLLAAMKCKQTTDTSQPAKLRELVGEFKTLSFAK